MRGGAFRGLCGAVLAVAGVLGVSVGVCVASASANEPFAIKSFTMQAVERTEEREVFGIGPDKTEKGVEFVNKPYTFTQAGGHPWALTTTGEFTTRSVPAPSGQIGDLVYPTHDPKDIVVTLPAGLFGDPQAVPRCPLSLVTSGRGRCPAGTIIGSYALDTGGFADGEIGPIVNVTPSAGESAEFALENLTPLFQQLLTAHLVRVANPVTGQREYQFTVNSNGIPQVALSRFELTFWGVPADPSHDAIRGRFCDKRGVDSAVECPFTHSGEPAGVEAVPFLSLGSDCGAGSLTATMRVDSWEEPGSVVEGRYSPQWTEATTTMPALTGCNLLSFAPQIEVSPNTLRADEPVELGVNVKVPQPESPGSLVTPHLRDAVVTLPQGLSISPGIVDGVQACDESGPQGINFDGPESEEVGLSGELQLAPGKCPAASVVGEAEAVSPLLGEPVKGHVYLARPSCGGPGQAACTEQDALDGHLYQLYLELGGEGALANTGINIKAHGFVEANPATGQLTSEFLENPQAPFSELKIRLSGGPRAPLDNPPGCGRATTTSDFTPWSAPGTTPEGLQVPGTPDATFSSYFEVDLAGDGLGTPCPSLPFSPGFVAGTVSPQAGAFSAFTLNFTRADREQFVKGLKVHTPPGLLALLSSVPLCPEDQANDPALYGECTASKIGTTRVASGAGSHPFEIEGNVYLTGPHDGAPFGLSVVTHAVAGPFNLGLVVVRARIDIDPTDSTATITTDETGPYALPQILFGVPLRLKQITVNIDRPGFMLNPTNCGAQEVTANLSGSQNATATVASPFAASGCRSLAFAPRFTVTTSGHTSRTDGATLDAKVSYPPFKAGSEANIAYVKVELPEQLPSRLTTLRKACTDATFDADPAACPSASIIGIVRASTPLLPVGLEGPVYFVSHGGEAFPSLIAVLQGDGVRVDLTGTTFISKAGITSSTFKTVPDVPVGAFELYLPEGPYSALTANGNLCKQAAKLKMPTEFIAQNGAVLKQSTRIAVTGCAGNKAKHRAKTNKKGRTGR